MNPGFRLRRVDTRLVGHGTVMNAERAGIDGPGDIRIEDADPITQTAHGNRQQRGDKGFSHAAFTAGYRNDFADRKLISWGASKKSFRLFVLEGQFSPQVLQS